MKPSDIAIVILSCDKFKVTWEPCIDHLFNTWTNCPYPVYLLNNFISCNDNRVTDLLVGEDLSWSDSLKNGLLKITEKRVFFIYDDSFITDLNLQKIESIFNTAIQNNFSSITLRKNPFDKGEKFDKDICKLSPHTKYRNALFLNLIIKDVLLSLLKSGENAWQFEKKGSIRSKDLDFYSVIDDRLAKYHHGIVKGKWLPKTRRYLLNNGYDLDDNQIQVYSYIRVWGINLYGILFFSLNKIVHKLTNR